MKKIFLIIGLLNILNIEVRASLKDADLLFEKNNYDKALEKYEEVLQKGNDEEKLSAAYRAVECEGLLFRYSDAVKRAFSINLPEENLWKSRFLLLRAEIAREFLNSYGYSLPTDIQEGIDYREPEKMTQKQWLEKINDSYNKIWGFKEKLVNIPINSESYFIDLKNADISYTPSLWDFVVLRWSEFLKSQNQDRKPQAELFLEEKYKTDFSNDLSPIEKIATIYEKSSILGGKDRQIAKEYWKLKRILIPVELPHLVSINSDIYSLAIDRLKSLMNSFLTIYAKSEAGYEAANLLNRKGDFKEAVELCSEIENEYPKTLASQKCQKMRAHIEMPYLSISQKSSPADEKNAISINVKNINTVFFRIYRTSIEDLKEKTENQYNKDRSFDFLRYISPETLKKFINSSAPLHNWSLKINYSKPYSNENITIDLPHLKPGIYIVIASNEDSFSPGKSMISGAILNITDLILLGSSGIKGKPSDFLFDPSNPEKVISSPLFHFYTLNGKTGLPEENVRIEIIKRKNYSNIETIYLNSDTNGIADIALPLSLSLNSNNSYSIEPLAYKGESYAWYGEDYLYYTPPDPLEVYIDIDRPIYRPGQKVKFRVTVLQKVSDGYKVYTRNSRIQIIVRDANYNEFFKKELKLNDMGSAAGFFEIPQDRLLGNYTLSASIIDFGKNYSSEKSFSVEEYKRPEFEVKLEKQDSLWKYGQKAKVKGNVQYYFGGPVPNAIVNYKVYRQSYIPWFCWWWKGYYSPESDNEIISGSIKTDEKGNFSFEFVPEPENPNYKDYPSNFLIEVDGRDSGGRTVSQSGNYKAGSKVYLFDINLKSNFFTEGKKNEISLRLLDLNENQISGYGEYEIYEIKEKNKKVSGIKEFFGKQAYSLEEEFSETENGKKVSGGKINFRQDKYSFINIHGLKEGIYRFVVRAKDPSGDISEQSIILVCAGVKGLDTENEIPDITIPEYKTYMVGEKAKILLGAQKLKGAKYIEIWKGDFLLDKMILKDKGISIFKLPIEKKHKGGILVRWFGVENFNIHWGEVKLDIPERERELEVKLNYKKHIKPSEKVHWTVTVRDFNKKGINGEAFIKVFDRSLEYYQKDSESWASLLYKEFINPSSLKFSMLNLPITSIQIEEGWLKKMLEVFRLAIREPIPPALRINKTRFEDGFFYKLGRATGGIFDIESDKIAPQIQMAEVKAVPARGSNKLSEGIIPAADESDKEGKILSRFEKTQARKDFSETALFKPQLRLKNGKAFFSFKMPERLTSWKINGYALTSDVKRGIFSFEAVTKKDLMVRLDMPRFFRENDSGQIKAIISNETDREISGEVALFISKDEEKKFFDFGLKEQDLVKNFSIKPHSIFTAIWEIKAPDETGVFDIKTVARSGEKTDAEEKKLPILPSKQRLIKSSFISLNGNTKKILEIKDFAKPDINKKFEILSFQIEPQLILTVINSMPLLVSYPYECTEQLMNKFVPLSIINSFYKKYPSLVKAVQKLPKRKTLTQPLKQEDTLRLIQLMETPWERISKGEESYLPIIDLFDAKTVETMAKDSLEKLKSYQLPDGSFPWFSGGNSNLYMTLYVLEGFAQALKYGVEIDENMVRKAISYINSQLPKHIKPDESSLSYILYAAYILTSFPQNWEETKNSLKMAETFVQFAEKNSMALTHLGRAYMVWIYSRLGEKDKANLYIERMMDGAKIDKDTGLYWTPEKISWLWYNDTLEKHAFILKTLQTFKPQDSRIEPMLKWLLFNRKGNEWKSTKATAASIYSILEIFKERGALNSPDIYNFSWDSADYSIKVESFDWLEKPIKFEKTGADIKESDSKIAIEKKGEGFGFASLTLVFSTENFSQDSGEGIMQIKREFFLREKEGKDYKLKPLASGEAVKVGDEVEIHISIKNASQFEYVHLKDPKPAGFEAEDLKSGWKWDKLSIYQEPRDSLTNFFMDWLPQGEYILKYRIKATTPGIYKIAPSVIQSLYAPEFSAYSKSFEIKVLEE